MCVLSDVQWSLDRQYRSPNGLACLDAGRTLALTARVVTSLIPSNPCAGGRKLLQTSDPVQTAAGNAQTLEDEANADAADIADEDAVGTHERY